MERLSEAEVELFAFCASASERNTCNTIVKNNLYRYPNNSYAGLAIQNNRKLLLKKKRTTNKSIFLHFMAIILTAILMITQHQDAGIVSLGFSVVKTNVRNRIFPFYYV